jgi:hypothetical protein
LLSALFSTAGPFSFVVYRRSIISNIKS